VTDKSKGSKQRKTRSPAGPTESDALPTQRTLVQACCERANLLSTPTPLTRGCRFVNITIEEDFTSARGVQIAIQALKV
jgi:hypothetical protein